MSKLTDEQKYDRDELRKEKKAHEALWKKPVKYTDKSRQAVVQQANGKRSFVTVTVSPKSLDAVLFGRRVFVKSQKDQVFYQVASENFYTLPRGYQRCEYD